jgi:hypothetical protein
MFRKHIRKRKPIFSIFSVVNSVLSPNLDELIEASIPA